MYDYDEIVAGLVTGRFFPMPYTWEDWNRVEYATEAMAALVTNEGYYVTISCKTDWNGTAVTAENWPSVSNMTRYWSNIVLIERQFGKMPGVSLPGSIYKWKYTEANELERFLMQVPSAVEYMKGKYRRCNTFACGN